MPLFKRKTEELVLPQAAPPSWSRRLGSIGDSIDSLPHQVRDVTIVTEGGPGDSGAIVNVLGYRHGQSYAGWIPMMYSVSQGPGVAPSLPESVAVATVGAIAPPPNPGEWGLRLRAIGSLLDTHPTRLRSVTVVDLAAGAVVNAIAPEPTFGAVSTVRSLEFSNEQISAAAAGFATKLPANARGFAR